MAMLVVNDYRSRFAASAGREVVTAGQASRSPSLAGSCKAHKLEGRKHLQSQNIFFFLLFIKLSS